MSSYNRILMKITVIAFVGLLLLPNLVMVLQLENKVVNNENRKHSEFPTLKFNKPLKSVSLFKSYYKENFGLKTSLVNSYISFKSNLLNEDPIPHRVVQGKEGWLFLGNHFNNGLNNSFGNNRFKPNELENITTYLEQIKNHLTQRNIAFYVVIPSDKNRIYQEYLPYKLQQNTTKLEFLKSHLSKTLELNIIDLYEPLVKAKNSEQVYIKTDTHWNDYGAFVGYDIVMNRLNEAFKITKLNLNDYTIISDNDYYGDIAKMINLNLKDTRIKFSKKVKRASRLKESKSNVYHYVNPNNNLKLLFYRDSFSNAWIPFFNETFGECLYIKNHDFNKSLIESYKPDIVIFEIIERNINNLGRYLEDNLK